MSCSFTAAAAAAAAAACPTIAAAARPVISPFLTPGRQPWQVLSDLGYPIDPEGMYQVRLEGKGFRVLRCCYDREVS
jgi:hypothetical protein